MTRILISAGMLICCIAASAQQKELDSLLYILSLHPRHDTTRIDMLNEIVYAYHTIEPDKGLQTADEAIALALQINNVSRLASSYSNKGVNYWAKGEDSLAMEMYMKALKIHEAAGNISGVGRMYNNIGLLYFNTSDYYNAVTYHQKGLNIFVDLKDSSRIATSLTNIGVEYQYVSDYPKALDHFFKALTIYEAKGNANNSSGIANALSNIGIIYKNLEQYDEALVYQHKALKAYEEMHNKQGMASAYGNLGIIYDLLSRPAEAIGFYLKALPLNEVSGNPRRIASDLSNLGVAYMHLSDYEKSFQYLLRSKKIYESSGDKHNLSGVLLQMGALYLNAPLSFLQQRNISPSARHITAMRYQKAALQLAKEIGALSLQSEALKSLSEIYEANFEPGKALATYKAYVLLRDSGVNDEKRVEMANRAAAFEFEKKAVLLGAEHDKAIALAGAEIKRQRIIRNAVLGGIAALLAAAFAGYVAYKRKRDAAEQRKDIEFKARVAETEMKALRAQMNPHFIFNSLNSIADYIGKNDIPAADSYLARFARLMRLILENSEQKAVPLADDLKALELYMQLEAKRLDNKFDYSISVAEDIDQDNTLVPPLLLQPFVENSIWHGLVNKKEGGEIKIRITSANGMLLCVVEDNGVGRQQTTGADKDVHIEKKSLGMKITRERIDIMNQSKNANASLTLHDLTQGLRAELRLPLETAF
ncbi:MAG TPA: tetratricopeptide repeat protein [Agriterribacter sp.]|nr:tetratricopeptide repeat protein [Agriterribacter sp.]